MSKKILISVTSDLVTDQRVNRSACTLKDMGYDVLVIGRKLKNGEEMPARRFRSLRIKLRFETGFLFYASYNFRLFRILLSKPADILLSNDLDTLLPNYLISRWKNIPLIYDSHEYFTGVPELAERPFVKGVWKRIERWIIPKLKNAYTVNDSIARLYKEEYGTHFSVVRNVPMKSFDISSDKRQLRKFLDLPLDQHIIILQGAGINIQRGAEEAVEAMKYLQDTLLLIVGNGDVIPQLKINVLKEGLGEKVKFIPRQQSKDLIKYTKAADLGLSLDKDNNINYRFSLPNKLFDYIQANIPILASDLPEVKKIIENYSIGMISPNHDPESLSKLMFLMLNDVVKRKEWEINLKIAAEELIWEKEKIHFQKIIDHLA